MHSSAAVTISTRGTIEAQAHLRLFKGQENTSSTAKCLIAVCEPELRAARVSRLAARTPSSASIGRARCTCIPGYVLMRHSIVWSVNKCLVWRLLVRISSG